MGVLAAVYGKNLQEPSFFLLISGASGRSRLGGP